MPKNYIVENIKSKGELITHTKSRNYLVKDVRPSSQISAETNKVYGVTLGAGMYIGLPFLLTYPTEQIVIQDHD